MHIFRLPAHNIEKLLHDKSGKNAIPKYSTKFQPHVKLTNEIYDLKNLDLPNSHVLVVDLNMFKEEAPVFYVHIRKEKLIEFMHICLFKAGLLTALTLRACVFINSIQSSRIISSHLCLTSIQNLLKL